MTSASEQYNAAIEQVSRTWFETMNALNARFPNRGTGGEIQPHVVVAQPSQATRDAWSKGHQAAVAADIEARRVAMEALKESSTLIAWAVEEGYWSEYGRSIAAFLERLPATKGDLFNWAKNERGWCETFDDLYDRAETAGVLEGLILAVPESVFTEPLHEVLRTGAGVTARQSLLDLGQEHGGGEGRRRVEEMLAAIEGGGDRDHLLELARRHGGNEGRTRVAELLNTVFGVAAPAVPGAVLPDHLAAREELLRLAGQHAGTEGHSTVAALLDRIDRGRRTVVADDETEGDEV